MRIGEGMSRILRSVCGCEWSVASVRPSVIHFRSMSIIGDMRDERRPMSMRRACRFASSWMHCPAWSGLSGFSQSHKRPLFYGKTMPINHAVAHLRDRLSLLRARIRERVGLESMPLSRKTDGSEGMPGAGKPRDDRPGMHHAATSPGPRATH